MQHTFKIILFLYILQLQFGDSSGVVTVNVMASVKQICHIQAATSNIKLQVQYKLEDDNPFSVHFNLGYSCDIGHLLGVSMAIVQTRLI